MTDRLNDGDLRQRFAALRAEDTPSAPRFRVPLGQRLPRRLSPAWIAVPAVAAAAALWIVGRGGRELETAYTIDMTSTVWVAPTDFLLATPGSDLLGTLPDVGSTALVIDLGAIEEQTNDTAS